MGARLKFWRRSRVPKKGSRDEAVESISRSLAARDGSAVKSHSTILQRLRRQISLDYHTIPPATQAKLEETSSGLASFRSSGPRAATACRNGKKEERLGLGAERGKIIFLANS